MNENGRGYGIMQLGAVFFVLGVRLGWGHLKIWAVHGPWVGRGPRPG